MRDVVVLVLAGSIGLAIGAFADVANPDYPEARSIADRIDSTWRSIVTEGADPQEAAAAAGLRVHTFEVSGRERTILTHATPTVAGSCYTFRFGPGILSQAGILEEPSSGCTPLPPGTLEPSGSWSEVLPSERITPPWFVPAVVVLFVAALYAATDIPLALLIRRQKPDPSRSRLTGSSANLESEVLSLES